MVEQQINLFDLSRFGIKKRGPYKEKEKKAEKINPYAYIAQLYTQIACFLPIPIMTKTQERYDFEHLTLWFSHYSADEYEYQGNTYPGEDFKLIHAELKGTENLYITERIYLHKKLIDLIHKGQTIYQAAESLQPLILKLKSGEAVLELDNGKNKKYSLE